MTAIYALTICLLLYAFGDFIAIKTKGILSLVFVLCVALLVGFWVGLPTDIVSVAGIAPLGSVSLGLLIVGVGTTMNLRELARQWKTVVASFVGCTVGVLIIMLIGRFIIGTDAAFAAAPIFAGATVALTIVSNALEGLGLTDSLGVIIIMVFALQKFIGVPLASFCLNREANLLLKDAERVALYANMETAEAATQKAKPLAFFSKLDKPVYNLTKLALTASLASALAALTNGKINFAIFALILGVLFAELGFLPANVLNKVDSYFLILFAVIMNVFSSLATVTPAKLLESFLPVVVVLLLGVVGVIFSAFVTAKLLKQSIWLNIALAITCTFGFPTTVLLSEEIAQGVATDETEKKALRNYLLPRMTVAGFVTVTVGSVILAGLIVPMLG